MFEATISEFPFVERLPKREKSAVGKALDLVREFSELCETRGTLIPCALATAVLDISRQRMSIILQEGRFEGAVRFRGAWYIPESSLLEYARKEKSRGGRPPTLRECISLGREICSK